MPDINITNITNESLLESLLAHPAISESRAALARLMCSSRQLQRAVHQHCIGQVHASCKVRTTEQFVVFSRWLARSGHLAKSVGLDAAYGDAWRGIVRDPTWEAALAGALQRAALAAPHGLQLQSFKGWASSSILLRSLPSSHLTQLHLRDLNAVPDSSVADVIAGLAGLTGLQELRLDGSKSDDGSPAPGAVEAYLPALPALTNLTSLTLCGTLQWQLLQIPALPQLQRLRLIMQLPNQQPELAREQSLLLGELTSVVELHLESIAVQLQDELPPQLQKLCSHDVWSVEPLCSLTRLSELWIGHTSTPALQLQRLGQALRSLRDVTLSYQTAGDVDRSAAGWPALQLKDLAVDVRDSRQQRMGHVTMQHIGSSTGLTSLDLLGCRLWNSYRWELAASLAKLTGLQQLCLLDVQFGTEEEDEQEVLGQLQEAAAMQQAAAAAAAAEEEAEGEAMMQQPAAGAGAALAAAALGQPAVAAAAGVAAAQPDVEGIPDIGGWPAILRAAAGLPQLRKLAYDGPVTAATNVQLSAATQLQRLSVPYSLPEEDNWDGPNEAQLMHLICSMPALHVLHLDDQPHVRDAAMPVIARLMTQLTKLSLNNCSHVTDTGLGYLTGMRQLCQLQLMGTGVTRLGACALLPDVDLMLDF
jgi:hypothetical protein